MAVAVAVAGEYVVTPHFVENKNDTCHMPSLPVGRKESVYSLLFMWKEGTLICSTKALTLQSLQSLQEQEEP